MTRLGVALTVYDAFEDLGISIDLIRENWSQANDVPIVVSCGYERLTSELDRFKIDQVTRYHTPPAPRLQSDFSPVGRISLRILEGIRQGCLKALTTQADYVIHAHADAWMFSYDRVASIVEDMERRRAVFAARIAHRPMSKAPVFDDHFFIFRTDFARESGLWDMAYDAPMFNPVFDVGGIHTMLFLLVEARVPFDRFFAYSNMAQNTGMYGEIVGSLLNPWNFESRFLLLHSNLRYGDDVLFLRQQYLKRFSRGRGVTLQGYLEKSFRPSSFLRQGKNCPYYWNPLNLAKGFREATIEVLRPAVRKLGRFVQ